MGSRGHQLGLFGVPESELNVYGDVSGLDVLDLGCGTAYLSAWIAKRGARPVGVDPTPAQLETAREMQKEFGLEFPLVEAIGEDVPLPDASFDLVASEFGASIWADPYRWIPEASRLLASRWPAGLPAQLDPRLAVHAHRGQRDGDSPTTAARHEPDRVGGHRRGRVPSPGRRADRDACATVASRSSG